MTEEITSEQLAEIEGQAESTPVTEYTPPEGWRVLAVGEALREGDVTVRKDGYCYPTERVGGWVGANQRYIRPIEPQPKPEPESDTELQAQVAFLKNREVTLGTRLQQEREVTTRLREELATQAETIRRLQMKLDAAQQVPADSPELRQLRADLVEVTQDRDTYRHAHELLVQDVNATHQRTKVMTIEAIVEWLVPIRTCGSQALATAVVSNLPHIMRSLTGLEDEEIE